MDITKAILRLKRQENAGIGRIFRVLRKIPRLEIIGDIVLYKSIIGTLSQNGYYVSFRSITRHFRNIDPNDYNPKERAEIIKDLKKVAYREDMDGLFYDEERSLLN